MSKTITIPVESSRPWVRSRLTGEMMPQFDEVSLPKAVFDELIARGGQHALHAWVRMLTTSVGTKQ